MLKVRLKLEALKDIDSTWKKGDTCVIVNHVFNTNNGIAYHPIDKGWKVIEMELLKYEKMNYDN
jgi:hypothetical protein